MITIEISQEAQELIRKFGGLPARVGVTIVYTMRLQNQATIGHIVAAKLKQAGPTFLNMRTGRLAGSVRATEPRISGAEITSSIGTNVKYAAVHEY